MTHPLQYGLPLVLALIIPNVMAEETAPLDALRQDVSTLQQQINSLQARPDSLFKNINIGGLIQTDGRWFDDSQASTNSLLIRRARIDIQGNVSDTISFRLLPEFSEGRDNGHLLDAYVDIKQGEHAIWRVGKFKSPIGIERVQSVPALSFVERGLTDNLVPNRDVGLALSYVTDSLDTIVGISNNAGDRQDINFDSDNGKAIFARVSWQPQQLPGAAIGMSGSVGETENNAALSTYQTSGKAPLLRYAEDVLRDGQERRIAAHAMWYVGQSGIFAEYVSSVSDLLNSRDNRITANNTGWQVVASWMLSGEQNAWKGVTPDHPSGAWEILLRASQLNVDPDVFSDFTDPQSTVSKATSTAIGLNWLASAHIKVLLNYEQTAFQNYASHNDRAEEKLLLARLQLTF